MNTYGEERELAETLVVLAGGAAIGAAQRFARECCVAGNLFSSRLWQRVAEAIDEFKGDSGQCSKRVGLHVSVAQVMNHVSFEATCETRSLNGTVQAPMPLPQPKSWVDVAENGDERC